MTIRDVDDAQNSITNGVDWMVERIAKLEKEVEELTEDRDSLKDDILDYKHQITQLEKDE